MVERLIEATLYASRWLLIPLFFGLAGLLLLLTVEFYETLIKTAFAIFETDKQELLLVVLKLVDMALVGSLIIMVAISGYENFVSKIAIDAEEDKPTIFSRLDPGTIKVKLALVIIAISSIHLLQVFMDIKSFTTEQVLLQIGVHLALILAGGAVALIDRLLTQKHGVAEH